MSILEWNFHVCRKHLTCFTVILTSQLSLTDWADWNLQMLLINTVVSRDKHCSYTWLDNVLICNCSWLDARDGTSVNNFEKVLKFAINIKSTTTEKFHTHIGCKQRECHSSKTNNSNKQTKNKHKQTWRTHFGAATLLEVWRKAGKSAKQNI
jgi:hypothetical protein